MPILSISFGSASVSFLYLKTAHEYKGYSYPYAYSKSIFGHFVSESDFYKELIQQVCKELEVEAGSYDLVIAGFPEPPELDLDAKLSISLDKILFEIPGYSCFYVGNFKLIHLNAFMYACPLVEYFVRTPSISLIDKVNNEANLSIYPQILPVNDLEKFDIDNVSRFYLARSMPVVKDELPILFTGFSPYTVHKDDYLNYLLALDLIREPGIFELKMDEENILSCLALINAYDSKLYASMEIYKFASIGTLLNSPGNTECLFESESGTKQLIEVEKNKLFFIPVDAASRAKIVIKNNLLGTTEKYISGGKLGFIIDTRDKLDNEVFTQQYLEKSYNTWIKDIKQVLENF